MNKMNAPEMEVVCFQSEDVIATSVYQLSSDAMSQIFATKQYHQEHPNVPIGTVKPWVETGHGLVINGTWTPGKSADLIRVSGDGIYEITNCTHDHEHNDVLSTASSGNQVITWILDHVGSGQ